MIEETRDLAEQEPHVIRQQIDETRSSITEKLEALEESVVGTVQHARDTVQETIDSVKESVQETVCTMKETVENTIGTVKETMEDTVNTVKDTFDLPMQVQRHPWPMVGGSFVVGLISGAIFGQFQKRREMPMERLASEGQVPTRAAPVPEYKREEPPAPREPGMLDRFQGEIDQVKSLAIGMAIGAVRDAIRENLRQNMPQVADQVNDVMDRITTKLGGRPVSGPVLPEGMFATKAGNRREPRFENRYDSV